jgi:hypothetical protein
VFWAVEPLFWVEALCYTTVTFVWTRESEAAQPLC